MGCGAGQQINQNKQFMGERSQNFSQVEHGLNIDTRNKINRLQTFVRNDMNYPMFVEEIMELAKEKSAVRPWLTGIIPPENEIEENNLLPKYSLKLDHVFGYKNENSRKNVFFLNDLQIVYMSSSLGIIQNLDDSSQVIFGGNSALKRVCHNNEITAIAVYKGDVTMVATGQRGIKPLVLIWSPSDTSVIFARAHLPIGTKTVAGISFDSKGKYIGIYGRDTNNTFYIYDIETGTFKWKEPTSGPILDLSFHPKLPIFCVVGMKMIGFCQMINHLNHNKMLPKHPNLQNKTFISCTYISEDTCVTADAKGFLLFWKNEALIKELSISKGFILLVKYCPLTGYLFATDSLKNVIVVHVKNANYSVKDHFAMGNSVIALDVNSEYEFILGYRNGDIVMHSYKGEPRKTTTIVKSHSSGRAMGLDFISNKQAVTTGEDNKIMIWNLRTRKCDLVGSISTANVDKKKETNTVFSKFNVSKKSWAVAVNRQKGHIAVGICNGCVSIRVNAKAINEKYVPDIQLIVNQAITELKYTNYGDSLAAGTENGWLFIMNANEKYKITHEIQLSSGIMTLDWDRSNKYVQCVTDKNELLFVSLANKIKLIKDPLETRKIEWPDITCKFGYTVQGIYLGSTDPDYISCVCKANRKNIICSGDDDQSVLLYNYPTISENPKIKKYCGHSEKVVRVRFSPDDNMVMTISGNDKSVIFWLVVQE